MAQVENKKPVCSTKTDLIYIIAFFSLPLWRHLKLTQTVTGRTKTDVNGRMTRGKSDTPHTSFYGYSQPVAVVRFGDRIALSLPLRCSLIFLFFLPLIIFSLSLARSRLLSTASPVLFLLPTRGVTIAIVVVVVVELDETSYNSSSIEHTALINRSPKKNRSRPNSPLRVARDMTEMNTRRHSWSWRSCFAAVKHNKKIKKQYTCPSK